MKCNPMTQQYQYLVSSSYWSDTHTPEAVFATRREATDAVKAAGGVWCHKNLVFELTCPVTAEPMYYTVSKVKAGTL